MEYHVTWAIDVEADAPVEAARLARAAQTRPGTWATLFETTDEQGHTVTVDLLDDGLTQEGSAEP